MSVSRRPWQGVANVVRFNYPMYLGAGLGVGAALLLARWFERPAGFAEAHLPTLRQPLASAAKLAAAFGAATTLSSLLASHWVYDRAGLFDLAWLEPVDHLLRNPRSPPPRIAAFSAGFDETTELVVQRYPHAEVHRYDFFSADQHTEPSIARARRAYPAHPGVITVSAVDLPIEETSVDVALAVLSAHEIRDAAERVQFFSRLRQTLVPGGRIGVMEHLRDAANFVAYNVGFNHFHSQVQWLTSFEQAGLAVVHRSAVTPLVQVFILSAKPAV